MPGVTVAVSEQCVGCGDCTREVCFVDAIHLVQGRSTINDRCVGCGRCVEVCPNQAITITVDDRLFVDNAIERLASLVQV
jgi:UDP-glucose 4-epimerase